MKPAIDCVHSINSYYDGPELGVADFEGRPCVYERLGDGRDGKRERYRVGPIDPDAFKAVLEDWQLYLKWDSTQNECSRQTIGDGPRVLATDLPRYLELKPLVEAALIIDEARSATVVGEFLERDTKVRWTRL